MWVHEVLTALITLTTIYLTYRRYVVDKAYDRLEEKFKEMSEERIKLLLRIEQLELREKTLLSQLEQREKSHLEQNRKLELELVEVRTRLEILSRPSLIPAPVTPTTPN
jgi:hypothetical protein